MAGASAPVAFRTIWTSLFLIRAMRDWITFRPVHMVLEATAAEVPATEFRRGPQEARDVNPRERPVLDDKEAAATGMAGPADQVPEVTRGWHG